MFNKYIWTLYLEANGKKTVKWFENNFQQSLSEDYALKIEEFLNTYSPCEQHPSYLYSELESLYNDFHSANSEFLYGCYSVLDLSTGNHTPTRIFNAFYKGLKNKVYGITSENQIFTEFCARMYYYTTFLSVQFPDFFVPYYFVCNYNVIERIAQDFDIALPEIPIKRNYKGRIYHYLHICTALHNFRKKT